MIIYLHSTMNHGIKIHWVNVDGVVFGLNSRKGVTDKNGWPVPVSATLAAAITETAANNG